MTRINLLPWREAERKERERQFYSIAGGAAVLAAVIVFYIHIHMSGLIDDQLARNDYLQKQIELVEEKITEISALETKKKNLLARMNIIQELQSQRSLIVHLYDELVRTLPEGVSISSVVQKGSAVTITGIAQSNASVSRFMGRLDESKWLDDPRLDVIKSKIIKEQRISEFTLRVNQISGTAAGDNG
ncbi:MAG: pilus assembly protein PilN [Gammaproteobacteria bacterium]|nr:pilus assembly protein PilN [Gammaproteobacteria bacterium]